nr:hypothetical protein CFP56_31137 [Quercus suber]
MIGQNFTLVLHYNGVLHHSVKKRTYVGGKVKVYDNVDSDCFSVPEVKNYCAELGVLDSFIILCLVDVDEALTDNEFEEGGNVVDEGNGVRAKDGNGVVGDVDYEWDNKQFKEFARAYKLKHGYGINLSKNEKARVRYKCVEGCPWKVSAVGRDVTMELALSKAYRARDIARDMVRGDFCEQYTKDTYIVLYSYLIQPCNGPDLFPEVDGDAIFPPIHKIQPMRPKIDRRRKDKDEVHNPYRMKRNQTSLSCAHCHQLGHNKRTCKSNQRPPGVATAKGKGKEQSKITRMVFEFI